MNVARLKESVRTHLLDIQNSAFYQTTFGKTIAFVDTMKKKNVSYIPGMSKEAKWGAGVAATMLVCGGVTFVAENVRQKELESQRHEVDLAMAPWLAQGITLPGGGTLDATADLNSPTKWGGSLIYLKSVNLETRVRDPLRYVFVWGQTTEGKRANFLVQLDAEGKNGRALFRSEETEELGPMMRMPLVDAQGSTVAWLEVPKVIDLSKGQSETGLVAVIVRPTGDGENYASLQFEYLLSQKDYSSFLMEWQNVLDPGGDVQAQGLPIGTPTLESTPSPIPPSAEILTPVVLQDIVKIVDEASVPTEFVTGVKSLNLETVKDAQWGYSEEWGWVVVKEGKIIFVDYQMTFSLDGKPTVVHLPLYFSQTTGEGNMVILTALRANDEIKVGLEVKGNDAMAREFYAMLLDHYKDREGTKFYENLQMAANGQMDVEFIRADLNMIPPDWRGADRQVHVATIDGAFPSYVMADGQRSVVVLVVAPHVSRGKLVFVEFSDVSSLPSSVEHPEDPSALSTFEAWIGGVIARSLGDVDGFDALLMRTQKELEVLRLFIDAVVI